MSSKTKNSPSKGTTARKELLQQPLAEEEVSTSSKAASPEPTHPSASATNSGGLGVGEVSQQQGAGTRRASAGGEFAGGSPSPSPVMSTTVREQAVAALAAGAANTATNKSTTAINLNNNNSVSGSNSGSANPPNINTLLGGSTTSTLVGGMRPFTTPTPTTGSTTTTATKAPAPAEEIHIRTLNTNEAITMHRHRHNGDDDVLIRELEYILQKATARPNLCRMDLYGPDTLNVSRTPAAMEFLKNLGFVQVVEAPSHRRQSNANGGFDESTATTMGGASTASLGHGTPSTSAPPTPTTAGLTPPSKGISPRSRAITSPTDGVLVPPKVDLRGHGHSYQMSGHHVAGARHYLQLAVVPDENSSHWQIFKKEVAKALDELKAARERNAGLLNLMLHRFIFFQPMATEYRFEITVREADDNGGDGVGAIDSEAAAEDKEVAAALAAARIAAGVTSAKAAAAKKEAAKSKSPASPMGDGAATTDGPRVETHITEFYPLNDAVPLNAPTATTMGGVNTPAGSPSAASGSGAGAAAASATPAAASAVPPPQLTLYENMMATFDLKHIDGPCTIDIAVYRYRTFRGDKPKAVGTLYFDNTSCVRKEIDLKDPRAPSGLPVGRITIEIQSLKLRQAALEAAMKKVAALEQEGEVASEPHMVATANLRRSLQVGGVIAVPLTENGTTNIDELGESTIDPLAATAAAVSPTNPADVSKQHIPFIEQQTIINTAAAMAAIDYTHGKYDADDYF